MGFHLLIFVILLSSAMPSTWPNQLHTEINYSNKI
jgi:hypothetical protein